VHLTELAGSDHDCKKEDALTRRWARLVQAPATQAGLKAPRLLFLQASLRRMHDPLLELVRGLQADDATRAVAVLIPELVKRKWWQFLLHTHRARRLRAKLLH
jgi:hypothetical protein